MALLDAQNVLSPPWRNQAVGKRRRNDVFTTRSAKKAVVPAETQEPDFSLVDPAHMFVLPPAHPR